MMSTVDRKRSALKSATRFPRVSVIIPCLNEEAAIENTIKAIPKRELTDMGYEVEILVVDNGSEDRTADLARRAGARVLAETERGKGRAFRTGLESVQADYVFMMDGDNTYPGSYIPAMLHLLQEKEFVIGSRLRRDVSREAMSGFNRAGNHLLSLMASVLCRKRITDVCTGLWGFRGDVIKDIALTAKGFELEMELFGKLAKRGSSFAEIPIPYAPRRSPSKLRVVEDGFKIGWTLVKLSFSSDGRPSRASWLPKNGRRV